MNKNEIHGMVREKYGKIAQKRGSSCCGPNSGGCGCGSSSTVEDLSGQVGYSADEMNQVPDGANLGLGCGNPTAIASLKKGETVIDLGSGGGFDCFLAAKQVGETGKVIGVDMTAEMVDKARKNAKEGGYDNVEFRLGEIEHLPAADNTADVIISNCVINLSPDKEQVFREMFRVLKPGGRITVSDIVLLGDLPKSILNSVAAYAGCVAGALYKDEYLKIAESVGFKNIEILKEKVFDTGFLSSDPIFQAINEESGVSAKDLEKAAKSVVSITLYAVRA